MLQWYTWRPLWERKPVKNSHRSNNLARKDQITTWHRCVLVISPEQCWLMPLHSIGPSELLESYLQKRKRIDTKDKNKFSLQNLPHAIASQAQKHQGKTTTQQKTPRSLNRALIPNKDRKEQSVFYRILKRRSRNRRGGTSASWGSAETSGRRARLRTARSRTADTRRAKSEDKTLHRQCIHV